MKKKIFLTAAIAAVMALSLAGCGVKVTDMAIPETATIEKGESVTLPINFGTDKGPGGDSGPRDRRCRHGREC